MRNAQDTYKMPIFKAYFVRDELLLTVGTALSYKINVPHFSVTATLGSNIGAPDTVHYAINRADHARCPIQLLLDNHTWRAGLSVRLRSTTLLPACLNAARAR